MFPGCPPDADLPTKCARGITHRNMGQPDFGRRGLGVSVTRLGQLGDGWLCRFEWKRGAIAKLAKHGWANMCETIQFTLHLVAHAASIAPLEGTQHLTQPCRCR